MPGGSADPTSSSPVIGFVCVVFLDFGLVVADFRFLDLGFGSGMARSLSPSSNFEVNWLEGKKFPGDHFV